MRSVTRSRVPLLRYLALSCVVLALAAAPVRAQSSAPVPDAEAVRVVESALERAARVWGSANVADGGASVGTTARVGGAALTGEVGAAAVGLTQAASVLVATGLALDLYMSRSGSIARYGNPYGMPADDIAFPLKRQLRAQRALRSVPSPFPLPEPTSTSAPKPGEERPDEPRAGRVYATYTRYNRKTGRHYAGRTSAIIDLDKDWEAQAHAAVKARHGKRNPDENPDPKGTGFLDGVLDEYAVGLAVDYAERYRDAGYHAIRGREQQLIDFHGAQRALARGIETFRGGAHSDTGSGEALTENAIRGVARDNPFGPIFHAAANLAFGQLAPYTGDTRYE